MTDFEPILHILSRFIHITSAILLLGGVFYARQVLVPILNGLPEDKRMQAAAGAQLRYRTTLFTLVALSMLSGLYNFLTAPHSKQYQMAFGIKILLVLHIYSTAILWSTSPYGDVNISGKGKQRLMSMGVAGLIVVLISAYLRSLTLSGH